MDLKKYFSLNYLGNTLLSTIKRFPISLILLLALFISVSCSILNVNLDKKLYFFLFYYTAIGSVLNLSLSVWRECNLNSKFKLPKIIVVNVLLIAYSIYTALQYPFISNEWLIIPGLLAISFTVLMSLFMLPFINDNSDTAAYNFSAKFFTSAICTLFAVLLLSAGITLLYTAVRFIFGITSVSQKPIAIFNAFLLILLFPVLLLSLLPYKQQLYDYPDVYLSKFSSGIIKFMFIPLLLLYVVVLYLYGLKSLILWQLPNGWVSILVSVSMFFVVAIYTILHVSNYYKTDKMSLLFVKYMPIIIIPLVLFMSIGIAKRFLDYGVTIYRIYLLVANLWFLVVSVGMIFLRTKRIMWIPASFTILFVIFSYSPLSAAHIALYSLKSSVKDWFISNKISMPMTPEEATKALKNTSDTDKALDISEKLHYITYNYPKERYADIVTDYFPNILPYENNESHISRSIFLNGKDISGIYYNSNLKILNTLDTTYRYFYDVKPRAYYNDDEILQSTLEYGFTPLGTSRRFVFKVNRDSLISKSASDYKNIDENFTIFFKNDSCLYILKKYDLDIHTGSSSLYSEGYLFVK